MKIAYQSFALAWLIAASLSSAPTLAKISAEEAARLVGPELTPLGAEPRR